MMKFRIAFFFLFSSCLVLAGCSGLDRADEAQLQKADILLGQSRVVEARREIQALISRYPARYGIRSSVVSLYFKHKLWSDAAAQIEQLLALNSTAKLDKTLSSEELASWYLSLGYALQNARDVGGAEQAYRRALKISPENPHTMNALAYFYAEEGIKLREALNLARCAVARAPTNAAIVDTLGWVEYKLGRFKSAARTLARAVRLMPDDATLRYHLGAAYWRLGRIQEAWIELNKALVIVPGCREAKKLLQYVQNRSPDRPK